MEVKIGYSHINCVGLTDLLDLPVNAIRIGTINEEGDRGVRLYIEAKETQITDDHIAVLRDIYGGQTVELVTGGKEDETITR